MAYPRKGSAIFNLPLVLSVVEGEVVASSTKFRVNQQINNVP